MSLWRKRGNSDTNRDTIAPNVHHNEQKPDHLVNIVTNLSIQSDDLSIKREKAMREVQRLGQEIEQNKEIEMKQAIKLAIEWIEKQPEETPHSKYDLDTRYVVLRELEAALAQPEQDNAYIYASNLAKTIWQKHYIKESPKFALLDTTEGVLTQIDNMTCGLVREKPAQPEQEPVALQYPQKDIDWQQEQQIKAQASIPPQRTWVGLTDKDRYEFAAAQYSWEELLIAAEKRLKEKNT